MSSFLGSFLRSISIFDIDPKQCKRSSVFSGTTNLEPDGSNLAIALRNILIDEEKKKSFSIIIRDLLPFIDSLSVERLADTSIITCVKEMQCRDRAFPAPLISDGTINLTALVLALYFDDAARAPTVAATVNYDGTPPGVPHLEGERIRERIVFPCRVLLGGQPSSPGTPRGPACR